MGRAERRNRKKPAYNPSNAVMRNEKSGKFIPSSGIDAKKQRVDELKESMKLAREVHATHSALTT